MMFKFFRFVSIIILSLLLTGFKPVLSAEYKSVAIDIVESIVLEEAYKIYGTVSKYNVETYYGIESNPEIYCFILYRKNDIPKNINKLKNELVDNNNKNIKKTYKKEFITVYAAANENHMPIIKMHAGLPPHLKYFNQAYSMSKSKFKKSNLKKIIYIDSMSVGFEFSEDMGNMVSHSRDKRADKEQERSIVVNPYSKKIYSLDDLIEKKKFLLTAKKSVKEEEKETLRQERLKKRWAKIKYADEKTTSSEQSSRESDSIQKPEKLETAPEPPSYREITVKKSN